MVSGFPGRCGPMRLSWVVRMAHTLYLNLPGLCLRVAQAREGWTGKGVRMRFPESGRDKGGPTAEWGEGGVFIISH